jgi:hypothetical protein
MPGRSCVARRLPRILRTSRYGRPKNGHHRATKGRFAIDSPVNQVLYALPSGQITGYIGLSVDELPVLYQVTTERMALRMFHSLMATIQVAEDAHLVRALKRREADFTSSVSSDCNRPLSLLQALF